MKRWIAAVVGTEGAFEPGQFLDAIAIPVVTTDVEEIRLSAKPKEVECVVESV